MTSEIRPHHHGNLRQTLIDAGFALLTEGGSAALTLRAAASRAGVSHAAPAHHFDGLPGLLTAIATEAFQRFTEHMVHARAAAPPDGFAQLLAICAGYLDFAADHEGLFQLMFGVAEVRRDDPALMAASAQAYAVLRAACQPFADAAPADTDTDTDLEIAVWSLVHGYALLGFARPGREHQNFAPVPAFPALLRRLVGPA